MRNAYNFFLSESLTVRDHSEDPGVHRKTTIEWILEKLGVEGIDWLHVA